VGVPDVFGSASLAWAPPAFHWIELSAGLQSVGDFFADDANRITVPGYTVYNAGVSLRPITVGSLQLQGTVKVDNLTDEKYVGSAFLNPDVIGGVPFMFEPGLPRHVFLSLGLGWVR
jgi:outer membrane receptor protein involved in Fe transport